MSSSTRANNITSRNKRPKLQGGDSSFEIPPSIFSEGENKTITPLKRSSISRLPFSPLTNSIHQSRSDGDVDNVSISRERRVLFYDSASSSITNSRKKRGPEQNSSIVHDPTPSTKEETETLEYVVEYPINVKLSSSVLYSAYKQAIKYGVHQRDLCEANCDQLSFTEVMIPSIIKMHNMELKKVEGKAKGRKAVNVEKKMRVYRCALKNCERKMIAKVEQVRQERKEQVRSEREKAKEKEIEEKKYNASERRKEKMRLQEEAKVQKLKQREIVRKQKKKEYKKNRELWKEVASLMAELGRIEKEEKVWSEVDLDGTTSQLLYDKELTGGEEQDTLDSSESTTCEEMNMLQSIIDGVTTSANRIVMTLSALPSVIEESDEVRKHVYHKYKTEHKFDGYRAHKDPRALIRALTLE